jgi:hypothetical protein
MAGRGVENVADATGELSCWDGWASDGKMKHADTPTPYSTPKVAMGRLLEHRRLIYGDQEDWSAWTFECREYATGTRAPRTIRFQYEGGAFVRV